MAISEVSIYAAWTPRDWTSATVISVMPTCAALISRNPEWKAPAWAGQNCPAAIFRTGCWLTKSLCLCTTARACDTPCCLNERQAPNLANRMPGPGPCAGQVCRVSTEPKSRRARGHAANRIYFSGYGHTQGLPEYLPAPGY